MKKYISVLLASLLIFANMSFASAQELNDGVEKVSFSTPETTITNYLQPKPTELSFQGIPSLAQKFGVSETWIYNEMAKGYTLTHIYEGLLEKQQDISYELHMDFFHPEDFVREKRKAEL